MPEIAKNFAKLLQEANGRQIAVVGHMRPDGDCVSSQLAMAELLRNAGAKVVCLNQDAIPYLLKNFSSEKLLNIAEFDASGWDIVLVDCSSLERANVEFAKKYNKIFACIDHHASGKSQAEINVIDIQAGATAEIIALALAELDLNISEENATLLFALRSGMPLLCLLSFSVHTVWVIFPLTPSMRRFRGCGYVSLFKTSNRLRAVCGRHFWTFMGFVGNIRAPRQANRVWY